MQSHPANAETIILSAKIRKLLKLKTLSVKVAARSHNKFVIKNHAKQASIPITNYELINENTTAQELIEKLDLPLIVKPIDKSGAQGVKTAKLKRQFQASCERAF
jgi:biotin carboxylase